VLPLVEQRAGVKLTKDPEGRATMGLSSSGAAAFTMAWLHPHLYHRVLAYSPTMVNEHWPWNPSLRGGAWEYHSARGARHAADPQFPHQTDPLLVRNGRPGPVLSEPDDPRRHARLDAVGRVDGEGAGCQGLSLVSVCAQRQARRPANRRPDKPVALEWLWKGYPIP
jgi:putative esterase